MTAGALASAIRKRLKASGRVGRKPFQRPTEAALIRGFMLLWLPMMMVQAVGDDVELAAVPFMAGLIGVSLLQGSRLLVLMLSSPEALFLRHLPAQAKDLTRCTFVLWLRGWLWCLLVVAGLIAKHGQAPPGVLIVMASTGALLFTSAVITIVTLLPFGSGSAFLGNSGLLMVLLAIVARFRAWRVPFDHAALRVPDSPGAAVFMTVVAAALLRLAYRIVEERWAKPLVDAEVLSRAAEPPVEPEAEWVSHVPARRKIAQQTTVPFSGFVETLVWRALRNEERSIALWLCGEVNQAWSKGALATFVVLAVMMLNPNLLVFALFAFQAVVGRFPGWLGALGSGFVVSPALFPVRGRTVIAAMMKVQLVKTIVVGIPLVIMGSILGSRLWIPAVLVAAQPIAAAARVLDAARPNWTHTPLVLAAFAPLGIGLTLLIQGLIENGPTGGAFGWLAVGEVTMVALAVWILERGRVDLVQKTTTTQVAQRSTP